MSPRSVFIQIKDKLEVGQLAVAKLETKHSVQESTRWQPDVCHSTELFPCSNNLPAAAVRPTQSGDRPGSYAHTVPTIKDEI